ncbi:MAG: hypothetical protein JHC85_14040, partial [Chthoniobacterales bacterium]|nr:hypothetical protein [Chthoniobacterales bacterium]
MPKHENIALVLSDASQDFFRPLSASELPAKWQHADSFVLLDTAFAFGRFAATCAAFEDASGTCAKLHYLTICPADTPAPELPLGSSAAWVRIQQQLSALWPPALPGLHQISLLQGRVQLHLAFGDTESQVRLF